MYCINPGAEWKQAVLTHTSLRAVQADQLLMRVTLHFNNDKVPVSTHSQSHGVWYLKSLLKHHALAGFAIKWSGKCRQIAGVSSAAAEAKNFLQCLSSPLYCHILMQTLHLFVQQTNTVCEALKTWHFQSGHTLPFTYKNPVMLRFPAVCKWHN